MGKNCSAAGVNQNTPDAGNWGNAPMWDEEKRRWEHLLRARVEAVLNAAGDGSHDLDHILRVWANCQAVGEAEAESDGEILIASAFLHDIVSLPKNAPNRHLASKEAAKEAMLILQEMAFPKAKLDCVFHAIEAHSFSAQITPETIEAKILQDADRLDALGAIGIARTFYVAGRMNSALFDQADPLGRARALDDKRFALDHFKVKLYAVAETMNTRKGRELAQSRLRAMQHFVENLIEELP